MIYQNIELFYLNYNFLIKKFYKKSIIKKKINAYKFLYIK